MRFTSLLLLSATVSAYLPSASTKIRGVNLGSYLVFEPWMAETSWKEMGCEGLDSEFDCVSHLGQETANSVFQNHWDAWINQTDIDRMVDYGINTIRIPVGYWIMESLVNTTNEYFPQGGLGYLERVCEWAATAGIFVVIDLHGAPGAQLAQQPSTGQYASEAGFYDAYNYQRMTKFFTWLTRKIHTEAVYRTVGVLELLNEPSSNASIYKDLNTAFYPQAIQAIQTVEASLNVTATKALSLQIMNTNWGSGTPLDAIRLPRTTASSHPIAGVAVTSIPGTSSQSTYAALNILYDAHNYLSYNTSLATTASAYLSASCAADLGANLPLLVGEWSLAVADGVAGSISQNQQNNSLSWFRDYFSRQRRRYESDGSRGWIFWAWKNELGDWRWSYQGAVEAGVVGDFSSSSGVCV